MNRLASRLIYFLITHGPKPVVDFIIEMDENSYEAYLCGEKTSYWEDFVNVLRRRWIWCTFSVRMHQLWRAELGIFGSVKSWWIQRAVYVLWTMIRKSPLSQ